MGIIGLSGSLHTATFVCRFVPARDIGPRRILLGPSNIRVALMANVTADRHLRGCGADRVIMGRGITVLLAGRGLVVISRCLADRHALGSMRAWREIAVLGTSITLHVLVVLACRRIPV